MAKNVSKLSMRNQIRVEHILADFAVYNVMNKYPNIVTNNEKNHTDVYNKSKQSSHNVTK